MKIHTRDQVRAQYAYRCVAGLVEKAPEQRKTYASLVNGFGATVMRNGLVAAVAFVRRRDDPAARAFLEHLSGASVPGVTGKSELLQQVIAMDVDQYLLATREVLALAVWFRRAMQASDAVAASSTPGREVVP